MSERKSSGRGPVEFLPLPLALILVPFCCAILAPDLVKEVMLDPSEGMSNFLFNTETGAVISVGVLATGAFFLVKEAIDKVKKNRRAK